MRSRPAENRPHHHNLPLPDYEDESHLLHPRPNDPNELKDLRARLRTMVGKLAAVKREKEALATEKEELEREVEALQVSLRHSVGGFSNSSSSFPMGQELLGRVAEFYKYDCLDAFFDLLAPAELTLKGIIFFYLQTFSAAHHLVDLHFQPALAALARTACLNSLEGPVLNVLRKAFQSRHHQILEEVLADRQRLAAKAREIGEELGLDCGEEGVTAIADFLSKLVTLLLLCRISDPPLVVEIASIGKRVDFNSLQHDPFDGFIRARQECFVILPQVVRTGCAEVLAKSLVLQRDYDPTN